MRLEDKIRPHALLWDCYNDEPEKYNHTNKLIKIAEEFAIGFAKYVLINHGKFKYIDLEKMLIVYKKEKGL